MLVVEDEDNLRAVIRRLLQGEGSGVLEAGDGASALRVLELPDHNVELVLTDLRMPVMDGRQLAAALARLHPYRLVSPHLSFLAKPFRNGDLVAAVKGQLERRA